VSGEDVSGGGASGGATGDEAAWQELVARFDMPVDWDSAAAPWPEREGLTAPSTPPGQVAPPGQGSPASQDAPANQQTPASQQAPASQDASPAPPGPPGRANGTSADRTRVVRPASPPVPAGPPWPPADPPSGRPAEAGEADDADEHYVPPPPPPLPHLDPVAKGAWTALFGGPAYLLIATLVGWTVAGWAALLAIAAFVGGFVVLVLRLGDGPSRGSGPDNGAVL
jgi:hypothetical protein